MRSLFILGLLLSGSWCFGEIPTRHLARPLPNGCLVHAVLYIAGLDPVVGSAEMVKVVGGGGIPHVIAVVSTPAGIRYGRDESLGVFPLDDLSPQAAYDRARREALATLRFRGGSTTVGALEVRRSLRAAFEMLRAAGFEPERVDDVIIWRIGGITYVYSPLRGCAEIRTCSVDLIRIASAAVKYWTTRR